MLTVCLNKLLALNELCILVWACPFFVLVSVQPFNLINAAFGNVGFPAREPGFSKARGLLVLAEVLKTLDPTILSCHIISLSLPNMR